ncbi:toxin co-regulated pilus biosynthesis Q family protein [Asaia spathodeae]|uniref:TcpQ domain-containing protein n=2 Tax=Asaia spathodeae TaxID=657016 RepID=A0ABX2P8C0_9PROT|nr:toxin co-regulated pilus biosynthesis Q family protein [Asaia spathodeae]
MTVDDASMVCDYGHDGFGGLQLVSQCTTYPGELLTLKAPHGELLSKIAPQGQIKSEPLPAVSGPLVLHPLAAQVPQPSAETTRAPTAALRAAAPLSLSPVPSVAPTASSTIPVTPLVASAPVVVPVTPVKPAETWLLVGGQPIRSQMQAWAARGGWILVWPQRLDWIVPASASFSGDYVAALTSVITDIAENGRSIRVRFHDPNRTAVVTNPAGDQLPQ